MLDGAEDIHAFNALLARKHGVLSYTLAEAAQFVGVRRVPNILVFWVAAKLAVLNHLAGVLV